MSHNLKVLYAVYWGALEPLGRSLVVPQVKLLAQKGAQITLLTWEKPDDWTKTDVVLGLKRELEAAGVSWVPLRYHHKPQAPATLLDMAQGALAVLKTRGFRRFDVVQGRTVIGGTLGLILAPLLGAKLAFHNEGYWADERADAGLWTPQGRSYRVAKALELRLYDRADAIFCLSKRSQIEILARQAVLEKKTPVEVVPSCVDLRLFSLRTAPLKPEGRARLLYAGTVGGEGAAQGLGVSNRYRLDEMAGFVRAGLRMGREVELRVLTRAPRAVVAQILEPILPPENWSCASVGHDQMVTELHLAHAGLHFMAPGRASHAGSPTKIGEYWATGLPVVCTQNLGDTGEIVARERVGVLAGDFSQNWNELEQFWGDETTAARCREAATRHYNLDAAVERIWDVWNELGR